MRRRRMLLGLALLSACASHPGEPPAAIGAPAPTAGGEASGAGPAPEVAASREAEPPSHVPRNALATEYASRGAVRALSGRASYYHDSLAGNPTASGVPYDPAAYTAASRDLPFGTVLRVTRTDTGAVTYVRVNDRGPFGNRRRILDLSRAAAEDLDMIRAGVIPIRAEILD